MLQTKRALPQLWVIFFINISHVDFAPGEGFLYYMKLDRFIVSGVEP